MRKFAVTFSFINATIVKHVYAVNDYSAVAKAAATLPSMDEWTTLFGDAVDLGLTPVRCEIVSHLIDETYEHLPCAS